jgi:hypothetical protein
VIARPATEKRDFNRISLLSRACDPVQGAGPGLKLAKKPETAEKELCLELLATRQML